MHHIYDMNDMNDAYVNFTARFGIEPNGVLMREETFDMLKRTMEDVFTKVDDNAIVTFMGKPIYRSEQMELNQIRFII